MQGKTPYVHLCRIFLLLARVLLCAFNRLNQLVNHRSLKHSVYPLFLEGTFIPGRPLFAKEGPELISPK